MPSLTDNACHPRLGQFRHVLEHLYIADEVLPGDGSQRVEARGNGAERSRHDAGDKQPGQPCQVRHLIQYEIRH